MNQCERAGAEADVAVEIAGSVMLVGFLIAVNSAIVVASLLKLIA